MAVRGRTGRFATASNRLLPLYSGFATLLGRRREAQGLVFPAPASGLPWNESMPATTFLERAYEDAGIRRAGVLWHALRHTYASLLGAGGIKQHEIELLMGHKVAGTTGLYLHVMRETFEKVDVILDQAFGDALRSRSNQAAVGGRISETTRPPVSGALRPSRF